MKPEDYLELYNRYSEMNIFDDIYGVSALNGTNVEELIERLTGYMEEGPMYYPEDMATDHRSASSSARLFGRSCWNT